MLAAGGTFRSQFKVGRGGIKGPLPAICIFPQLLILHAAGRLNALIWSAAALRIKDARIGSKNPAQIIPTLPAAQKEEEEEGGAASAALKAADAEIIIS